MKHLILAALLLATPASAATDFTKVLKCQSADTALVGMGQAADAVHATRFKVDGAKLAPFMAAMNAMPPATDFKPDAVAGMALQGVLVFGLYDKKHNVLCGPIKVGKDISAPLLRILGIKEEAEENKI